MNKAVRPQDDLFRFVNGTWLDNTPFPPEYASAGIGIMLFEMVTARLPLMVRPSPPRFLNFGDAFQLPVVVQNQTDAAMTVRLAVRTTNAALTGVIKRVHGLGAARRVEVQLAALDALVEIDTPRSQPLSVGDTVGLKPQRYRIFADAR